MILHVLIALFGGRVLPPQQWAEMTSVVSVKTGRPILDTTADDPVGFGLGIGRTYSADQGGHYPYNADFGHIFNQN